MFTYDVEGLSVEDLVLNVRPGTVEEGERLERVFSCFRVKLRRPETEQVFSQMVLKLFMRETAFH